MVAYNLFRSDRGLRRFHWAFCLDVTDSDESDKVAGLLWDIQYVVGQATSFILKERLQLPPLSQAEGFVSAIYVGEVDDGQRSEVLHALDLVTKETEPGEDGTNWLDSGIKALATAGFVMPEATTSWVFDQILQAAETRNHSFEDLPAYLKIVSSNHPFHLFSRCIDVPTFSGPKAVSNSAARMGVWASQSTVEQCTCP